MDNAEFNLTIWELVKKLLLITEIYFLFRRTKFLTIQIKLTIIIFISILFFETKNNGIQL